jgi:hypothetical protein
MKISGFTIIRNAVINDYPIVEAIRSILPVVDEMIVSIGKSDDTTEELIRSIDSDKIKIHYSTWDMSLRKGGKVLAVETDKAFQLISPDSTWAFYIQGDEVVHEKYHAIIREAAEKYKNDPLVEGLLFHYLHFYGTYDYVGDSRRWYNKEIRIIRNDKAVSSFRDAQGFRKGLQKLKVKLIDAYIYHYGWVKSPEKMGKKRKNVGFFWHDDEELLSESDVFDFTTFDALSRFEGTHPAVMTKRAQEKNWTLDLDISKKNFSFKNRMLHFIEKKTGRRLFSFTNYKII